MEYICLKVKDEQRDFVTDNARSLAEARFGEDLYTRTIYSDGVIVGFVLFDYDPEFPRWCISRFMIGTQYQGRGLGREAVLRFLDFMREHMGVWEFYPHVELENTTTHEMYQRLDFRAVQEVQCTFDGMIYRERRMKICL